MSQDKSQERLLTVSDVARLLQVHPSTIRRWEKQGGLKSYRIGPNSIRFRRDDIHAFIDLAKTPPRGLGKKDLENSWTNY